MNNEGTVCVRRTPWMVGMTHGLNGLTGWAGGCVTDDGPAGVTTGPERFPETDSA